MIAMSKKRRLQEIRDEIKDYVITVNTRKKSEQLSHIEKRLKELVIGQDRAIEHIVRRLGILYSGLKDPRRPIVSMIFMGLTGTGKTYTAKKLANILLGDEDSEEEAAVIIECANLTERHTIRTLLGAPPSYVGYGDLPLFAQKNIEKAHETQIIKQYQGDIGRLSKIVAHEVGISLDKAQQFVRSVLLEHHRLISVIILDEIEEAHRNIIRLLLNIFEEGKTTLADGSVTDFSNSIFILTSNVGSENIQKLFNKPLGYVLPHQKKEEQETLDDKVYTVSKKALERNYKFPPKFIGRIRGEIIVFRTLTESHHFKILDLMLDDIQKRLNGGNGDEPPILLSYTDEFKRFLVKEGVDPKYGVRNLRAVVERYVSYELGKAIVSGQLRAGEKVLFAIADGKPILKRKPRPKGKKLPELQKKIIGEKINLEEAVRKNFGLPLENS